MMSKGAPMNAQERRRLIEERKELTNDSIRLWCKDDWRPFGVFRVPVDALLLNVDNRRFAAERRLFEEQLGHTLDPENSPSDELSVISILLDTGWEFEGTPVRGKPSKDTEALKIDWLRRKQETPFWIRPDGTVRNGNRRLALLKRLRSEGGVEGTEWVNAVILDPALIDEGELFEMEQREQLTEDFKVRYTDINLLLALRDAAISRGIDWTDQESIERVAGELQHAAGGDKNYATIQLQAIRYMDAYLADSNAPRQYQKLIRQVERFRDVGKIMARMEEQYPDDAPDMLRLTFAAIRAGNPHGDIRWARKIFLTDRTRYKKLLAQVMEEEERWEQQAGSQLENPDLGTVIGEDEDDDTEPEPPGPTVPNYPAESVRQKIKNAIDGVVVATLDVASTLEQIQSRLDVLSRDPNKLEGALRSERAAAVRVSLSAIVAWADRVRSLLDAQP